MKVCITGSSGLLGSELYKQCTNAGFHVKSVPRDFLGFKNRKKLFDHLRGMDYVIHCAANTNVELCESEWKECYRDNALITELLAQTASELDVKTVYVSSTGVYGNYSDDPYTEYDLALPTTHHHRAKLLGEIATLKFPRSLVVRTGWLFGGDVHNPKNFVKKRIDEAISDTKLVASNCEQFGNPSYVADVATRLIYLLEVGATGVFNCVNTGFASRFDYVLRIFDNLGLAHKVIKKQSSYFNRIANVSHNEMALNLKMEHCGFPEMRCWTSALDEYVHLLR